MDEILTLDAPPAKACTLRALMLAALADGESRLDNPLLADDQLNLIAALRRLGISVTVGNQGRSVHLCGGGGVFSPAVADGEDAAEIDLGESGVAMNFLAASSVFSDKPVILTGKPGLLRRPLSDLIEPVRKWGGYGDGQIESLGTDGYPPIKIHPLHRDSDRAAGERPPVDLHVRGSMTSQYLSGLAVAVGAYAAPGSRITVGGGLTERPYFDITRQYMDLFGVETVCDPSYRWVEFPFERRYRGADLRIEGDYSSAAFFFLAAALSGKPIRVAGLLADSKQGDRAVLDLFCAMGCGCEPDPSGITLKRSRPLQPVDADMGDIPDLFPAAAVAAAFADGESRFGRVGHLRHKESDRLEAVASELQKIGIASRIEEDAFTVIGGNPRGNAAIDSHGDHRIAMSFGTASLLLPGLTVDDKQCVNKSFPGFWGELARIRAYVGG